MDNSKKYFDDDFTPEEREAFEEKFCKGTFKARVLTEEEVEQLKKEGRILNHFRS